VIVVIVNGERVQVDGRVAEIIQFVLRRVDRIARAEKIRIEHNCAGRQVQSKISVFEAETIVMK